MIERQNKTRFMQVTLAFALVCLVSFSGCVGALSQLMYVIKGHDVPAAYPGLVDKRVAVICVSDASAYGPDSLGQTVASAVSIKLAQGVKKIKLVPMAKINNWVDEYGWDELDFVTLGKGVNAERVVAIEIASYSIHEGATMYKGRANVAVTVYNLENEEGSNIDFSYGPLDYEFPKNGRPAIQTNDRQFEAFYLARLTEQISRQFMVYDKLEAFAEEGIIGY